MPGRVTAMYLITLPAKYDVNVELEIYFRRSADLPLPGGCKQTILEDVKSIGEP